MKHTVHGVRHGQTTSNASGHIQGQSESPLSELGRRQAQAVAQALRPQPLAAVYASDLGRAQETAGPLAAACDLPIRLHTALRERHYGALEGLTWAQVEREHPEAYAALGLGTAGYRLPEGESRTELCARVVAVLEEIAVRHAGQEVAVVTHGGVASVFFSHIVGLDLSVRPPIRTHNGSISTFERSSRGWKLITWGAIQHLGSALSPPAGPGSRSTA